MKLNSNFLERNGRDSLGVSKPYRTVIPLPPTNVEEGVSLPQKGWRSTTRAVKQEPSLIEYIDNPTEQTQLEAIRKDEYVIKYIENPSIKVQLEAVKQNGFAIEYIKNPSIEVQLEAIKERVTSIEYIDNPADEVLIIVINCFFKSLDITSKKCIELLKNNI